MIFTAYPHGQVLVGELTEEQEWAWRRYTQLMSSVPTKPWGVPYYPEARSEWRAHVRHYPCPTCGSPSGAECRTRRGRLAEGPHYDRAQIPLLLWRMYPDVLAAAEAMA